jgi:FlaA1/EpsC-like NDP-sugar epimerase
LRPGEKLFEELLRDGESILPTFHEKIRIFGGPRVQVERVKAWVAQMEGILYRRNESDAIAHLCKLVQEYTPSDRSSLERDRKSPQTATYA